MLEHTRPHHHEKAVGTPADETDHGGEPVPGDEPIPDDESTLRPTRRATLGWGATALGAGALTLSGAPAASAAGTGAVASDVPRAPMEPTDHSGLTTIPAVREFRPGTGEFTWTGGLVVEGGNEELATVAETFADDLEHLTGTRPDPTTSSSAPAGSILLTLGDQGQGKESYALDIGETLTVTGTTAHGAFNGTRTVLQLLAQSETISAGTVADWPDKEVRSVLIDNTPRHFSLGAWQTLVRHMSYVKLNDTNLYVDGVGLSIEELREIDDLAARYYVTVVPQLNMPAHMNQILPAHPEYQLENPDGTKYTIALDLTNPEAVDWALGRLEEYLDVFRSAEWHLGSDEFPGWPGTGENHPQLDAYAKERFGPEATFADLFADFQNQANALVRSHGKSMRVWNDMIRQSSVVQLDTDVTVEYWIEHDELPGLLSPNDIAERGNPLINAHVDFLYYDQSVRNLDPLVMYEEFHTGLFPYRNDVPDDAVRGARIAVWLFFIGTPIESDAEVIANLVPSLNVHGQITWGTEKIAADYAAFRGIQEAVGRAPGSSWLGTGDIAPNPQLVAAADGSVAVLARTTDGALLTGKQSRPGRTHWSAQEIASDIAGDVQVTTLPDGRWRAAARAIRGLVIATQTAPEADEAEVVRHSMPLDEDPALAGQAVIVSSRRSLLLVDPDSGDTTRLGTPARGPVAADHHGSVVAAAADSPRGMLVVSGSGDSWSALHADRSLPEPQVAVTEESTWVIGVDEDGVLLAGVVDDDAVTWEEVDTEVIGRPAVATAPDGTVHIASAHEDGEIRLHRPADGAWTTQSPLTGMLGDPAIGFTEEGDVRVLGHAVRETLRVAQPGQDGWEVAELAESTVGRASLTWDAQGWPIYAITTAYGDLQTGTHWGEGADDWGRDFIIGTMSTPGDHLHPDEFETSLHSDDFATDTGEYVSLPADPDLPAPEPEIGQGRLAVTAQGAFSTVVRSQAPLPEGDAVVTATVETLPVPDQGDGTAGVGIVRDEQNYALMWVSSAGRIGWEVRTDGLLTDVSGDIPRVVEAGDRIALTLSGIWMTGWVQRHGIWDRVHTQQVNVAEDVTDPEVRTSYFWALALRGDGLEVAFSDLEAFGR